MEEADVSLEEQCSCQWTVSFSVSHDKGRLFYHHSSCTFVFLLSLLPVLPTCSFSSPALSFFFP